MNLIEGFMSVAFVTFFSYGVQLDCSLANVYLKIRELTRDT